jgi:probable rRNA maturation factor
MTKLKTGERAQLKKLIRRVVQAALKAEEAPACAEVSVVIADDELLHELNSTYRSVDAPTDVLAFSQFSGADILSEAPEEQALPLGDVLISLDRARAQACQFGHCLEKEVAFLTIHGVLHLLGYEHDNPEAEARMMSRTRELLQLVELRE